MSETERRKTIKDLLLEHDHVLAIQTQCMREFSAAMKLMVSFNENILERIQVLESTLGGK